MTTEEWPESEEPVGFDWTLSMKEIERKYNPSPVIQRRPQIMDKAAISAVPKVKPEPGLILAKFRRKYPYVYGLLEEANSDLPRWLIDNMLKISL